jgi:transcriptional antiterminator RfaH
MLAHTQYSTASGKWVVVNTHPHKEAFATENLERQSFSVYCPLVRKQIRHARRVQDVLRPLFPGYLFVQIGPAMQRWQSIYSTFGVRSLVCCGERLSYLDDGFIRSLKARELEGAIVRPESPYTIGQQVRLSGGPFDGLVATIIDMSERDRLIVLMDLLSRPVKVMVDASNVMAT